jgi:outer membrane protein TolC
MQKSVLQAAFCFAVALLVLVLSILLPAASAQTGPQHDRPDSGPPSAPLTLTLQDALQRAKKNNPQFQAAVTAQGVAEAQRVQARATLLPNANYNMSFIYTQGNGVPGVGRFVANNGVHEYVAQGDVHQVLSAGMLAEYHSAAAAAAAARARSEIAARGLVVTVVQAYYAYLADQRKYATAQQAATESERFLEISQKLEKGGEVAHSDVVKAQIQHQQKRRDLQESELQMNKSHLDLAVLLFPDFNENFTVVDDFRSPEALPGFADVAADAARNNPELRQAMAALKQADADVTVAWSGLLPSLSVDYFYGIDANQFATRSVDGTHNLGYSAVATLQLPIWSWGANRSKVRQAKLVRNQARLELSFAQRQLLANLRSFYNELQTARSELDLLGQSAALAAESLRLTTLRYQGGEATVLEVVDAQNTLMQARNAFDDGQVRYRVAQANLQTLTGSL